MSKKIGIVGITGRMGALVADMINKDSSYNLGSSVSSQADNLQEVFDQNDYVIDFSSMELTERILRTMLVSPKPLALCTTGWDVQKLSPLIQEASQLTPIVIAPNTSLGAALQRHLIRELSRILGDDYDIDIIEEHHKNKVDSPSGTARTLIKEIQEIKNTIYDANYDIYSQHGPRSKHSIGVLSRRLGNVTGTHKVSFTSAEESLDITHVAFSRTLFARGALKIVEWIDKNKIQSGVYDMFDVLGISKHSLF